MKPHSSPPSAIYRGMDQKTLDAAYNNRAAVAESDAWLQSWRERSNVVRAAANVRLNERYGPAPRSTFDYFPCDRKYAPLLAFIHGGYWQTNDKSMFSFIAEGPCSIGINVATIGYTLAPEASLGQIVEEVQAAVKELSKQSHRLGFDPDRIVVGGWSAGGHLAAMTLNNPATTAVLAISGIFDLTPISLCYVNNALRLCTDDIAKLSPALLPPSISTPISIAYGRAELPELQRQSVEYAAICKMTQPGTRLIDLPKRNHFSILDDLSQKGGALTQELFRLTSL